MDIRFLPFGEGILRSKLPDDFTIKRVVAFIIKRVLRFNLARFWFHELHSGYLFCVSKELGYETATFWTFCIVCCSTTRTVAVAAHRILL